MSWRLGVRRDCRSAGWRLTLGIWIVHPHRRQRSIRFSRQGNQCLASIVSKWARRNGLYRRLLSCTALVSRFGNDTFAQNFARDADHQLRVWNLRWADWRVLGNLAPTSGATTFLSVSSSSRCLRWRSSAKSRIDVLGHNLGPEQSMRQHSQFNSQ